MGSKYTYKKGYIVSDRCQTPIIGFESCIFSGKYIQYEKSLDVNVFELPKISVLVFGVMIDIRDENSSTKKCLSYIANNISDRESLYKFLDYTSGRYVLIYKILDEVRIVSDATGLKSIFYLANGSVCASHAKLISWYECKVASSECAKYEQEVLRSQGSRYKYGYPGFVTPFLNINILPPNNELILSTGEIRRIFPREENSQNSLDRIDSIYLIRKYMENQIKSILHVNKKIYCSLTAGLDSRFTLAAASRFKEITFLTYFYPGNPIHESDVLTAKLISRVLKLEHIALKVDPAGENSEDYRNLVMDLINNNIFSPHGRSIVFSYLRNFGEENILIRSNLYEIGRAFWQTAGYSASDFKNDENKLAKYFLGIYNNKLLSSEAAINAFYEYIVNSKFCNNIFNYDPLDLFYWEHRMGVWHSQVVTESDPAFDTLILCNSREIFKIFLSLDIEDRKNGVFFRESIDESLSSIRDIPINKVEMDEYDQLIVILKREQSSLFGEIVVSDKKNDDEFAFYLYRDKERIRVFPYGKSPEILVENINTPGKYYIRGFFRRKKHVIAKSSRPIRILGCVRKKNINEIIKEGLSSGVYNIKINKWNFDINLKIGTEDGLIVFLNGAIGDRSKVNLPLFQRNSWARDFSESVLNISDPTLYLDNSLRLGWYWGSMAAPLQDELSKLIFLIADSLGIEREKIILYGSSGGGFASLHLGAYMNSGVGVVAINPQTNILEYMPFAVENFLRVTCSGYGGIRKDEFLEKYKDKFSVIENWRLHPNIKAVIYQNKLDSHHYRYHFRPFIDGLNLREDFIDIERGVATVTFSDSRGHVGENRSMATELVNIVKKIGSSPLWNSHYQQ